jgi:hypothetical protein
MVHITFEKINETLGRVTRKHFKPEDLPSIEQMKGVFVEGIPPEEVIPGKEGVLYINPSTKELWYDYIDKPALTLSQLDDAVAKGIITQETADSLRNL